jgi:hypothetical protein
MSIILVQSWKKAHTKCKRAHKFCSIQLMRDATDTEFLSGAQDITSNPCGSILIGVGMSSHYAQRLHLDEATPELS